MHDKSNSSLGRLCGNRVHDCSAFDERGHAVVLLGWVAF